MIKRLTVAWMVCLFTCNATLGALGGLVLCLHQDLSLHLEADLQEELCHDDHSCSSESMSAGDCQPCVDLSLEGELLPAIRSSELESLQAPACPVAPLAPAYHLFPITPVKPGNGPIPPQAEIVRVSELIVSSIVLRI